MHVVGARTGPPLTVDHIRARREIAEFRRAFEDASGLASASPWLAVGVVVWLVSGFVLLFYPLGFVSNGHDTNTTL